MKIMNKLEEWIGGALFLAIFLILIAQIVARQVIHMPLIWSEELARLLFVYTALLGISMAVRAQQHVYIDFITNLMPLTIKRMAMTFVQLLIFVSIILFIYLGYGVWADATFPMEALKATFGTEITQKWLYAGLPIIASLMLFRF